jgi:hypothetical protein
MPEVELPMKTYQPFRSVDFEDDSFCSILLHSFLQTARVRVRLKKLLQVKIGYFESFLHHHHT